MHDRLHHDVHHIDSDAGDSAQPEGGGDTVVIFIPEASFRLSEETPKDAPCWQLTAHDGTG